MTIVFVTSKLSKTSYVGLMLKLTLPLLATLVLTTTAAAAQENGPPDNSGTGYIGVSGILASEYPGSADEEVRILPYLSFEDVKGFDLLGTTLSYRAIETGTGQGLDKWSLRAGPSLSFQGGRDEDESPNLTGFGDLGASFPLGGYVRSTIGPVGLNLNVAKDIAGGHGGWVADASIGTFYRTGNFAILPSFTLSFADDNFADSFFSVTPEQSALSGLDSYLAGSGLQSYSVGVLSFVEFSDVYAVSVFASYRTFTNDAKDSPILRADDGSRDGIFAALSLSRKFDTKQW